jgi:hypothetical protein
MTSGPRPRSCVILIKPVNRTNPVFVVGSPRSGTTLLYHTLLSSGCFAVYRAETEIFSTIAFRFDFSSPVGLQRLLDVWILSDLFQLSGLDAGRFRDRIMRECRNSGDFLRIFMESIARQQHVERWAEKTPDHLLYAAEIKKTIPDALFIHIIRDGRDVAASMGVLGYIPVLPWDKSREVLAAGLYWEWLLRQGRKAIQSLGQDCLEVRYEDLITNPQPTLNRISSFIGCDLDYEQIRQTGIGAVLKPNTAFPDSRDPFIGRWKTVLPPGIARRLEEMIAPTLRELGYQPELVGDASPASRASRQMRAAYHSLFHTKRWLKQRTPFNRMVRLSPLRPWFVNASGSRSSERFAQRVRNTG